MSRRLLALVAATAAVAVVGVGLPSFSSAAFTQSSTSTATVRAAADWTPPTVSVTSPGSVVKDTVTVAAEAVDRESGIDRVTLQYLPAAGGSWTDMCTATAAPYSCAWNTKALADGTYDLRARATDKAGYTTVSEQVRTTVANNLLVVLSSPGEVVRGNVPLTTTLYNTGTVTYTVRVEYAPAGSTNWKSICTNLSAPYSCTWATTGYQNQDYDLRAVATSGGTTHVSQVVADVLVDNQAPAVAMADPGSPLSGTRTFEATASDTHSGVAQVRLQYAAAGTTVWHDLCSMADLPYSCRFDTTKIVDGTYSFRAVATDVAGNVTVSTTVTNRVVDNTVSSVSMEDPGAYLAGTVTLTATANSTAGVSSVRIQRVAGGGSAWTDVCTDTGAPFSCAWDTTTVADGPYDLRAVMVDGTGKETVSATVSGRRVDNSPLRGVDVQAANESGTAGRLDAGDLVTLTYSEPVQLSTVTPGWSGSPLAVTIRVRDGNVLGLGNKGDTLDVLRSGAAVNLGSVALREDFVKNNRTVTFTATMTASASANGGTRVTLQLGSLASGRGLRTVSLAGTMVWTPSGAATDLNGRAGATAPVTETGASDREF